MADETAALQTAAVGAADDGFWTGDRVRRLRRYLKQLGIRRDTPTWLIKEIIMQARRRAKGLRNRLEPAAATPPKRRSLRPRLPTTGHRRPQTATTATDQRPFGQTCGLHFRGSAERLTTMASTAGHRIRYRRALRRHPSSMAACDVSSFRAPR